MTIFKYEFKLYVKSIIIWSLAVWGMLFMCMAIFPSFSADTAMVEKMMENYPEEMLKAFGMNSGVSLSTVLGYFIFIYAFIQLFLAIQASNYGFSCLSIEERELTADFLMSKPVSRTNIIISKFLAALLALTITNLLVWAGTFLSIELFRDGKAYDAGKVMLLLGTNVLFQLFFLSVGMIISVSVKRIKSVLSYSMALAFGLYMLNSLRSIFGGELLGIISPFYHFDPAYILDKGEINLPMVGVSIFVIIVSIGISYVLYNKRNIHSL
ncbi:ABC transporter permease [Clostridium sp. DL1XJH146]